MGSSLKDAHQSLQTLLNDVVFDHIGHHLLSHEIITSNDYHNIISLKTEPEQMKAVLNILSGKESEEFSKFVEILEKDYKWVAEKLKMNNFELLKEQTTKISPLFTRVTTEMIKLVQKNYRVADKWTSLAHALDLTKHIMNIRIKVQTYGEEHSMCIMYLLQEWIGISSNNATLGTLIQVLREQEFNDVADELEEKYAE